MTDSAWRIEKLSNLADTCLGKMLDQKKNKGKLFPYLANINVRWGRFDLENLRKMKFEDREFDRYGLKAGDIVMCEGGEPGRCALWKGQHTSMMLQKALHRIRANSGVDSTFLYYSLLNIGLQGQFDGYFTGSAIKHLTGESLRKVELSIPGLLIQQKIGAVLSAYDDLIGNNLERIKLLEEMAQITYEEWFVRMKFPGHEEAEIDAEIGLPQGWSNGRITDICHVNKDSITAKKAPEMIRYIDIASVNTGSYEKATIMGFSEAPSRARRKLKFGDTIFSTVRPNRKTYSLILEDTDNLVASTGFAALRPLIEETYSFVYLSVANQGFVDAAVAVAGGAAYPAVKQSDFEKIKITVPAPSLIKQFSRTYNKNFEVISSLEKQNYLLQETRDILLPRLMTGMIDIETIELPQALLDRINTENYKNI
jgi:type I restriction enzyme S subunit